MHALCRWPGWPYCVTTRCYKVTNCVVNSKLIIRPYASETNCWKCFGRMVNEVSTESSINRIEWKWIIFRDPTMEIHKNCNEVTFTSYFLQQKHDTWGRIARWDVRTAKMIHWFRDRHSTQCTTLRPNQFIQNQYCNLWTLQGSSLTYWDLCEVGSRLKF